MADELVVMCSGAFIRVLSHLLPQFQRELGIGVSVVQGPSIGTTPRAIPVRLRQGETADLVILFDDVLRGLLDEGLLLAGTQVRLATSGIGVAVRSGAPEPEIGTGDALRRVLLAVSSFAYSTSASGIYVSSTLLSTLGLGAEIASKGVAVAGEAVGLVVARGDAELGFQQLSELLPIEGVSVLGPLPVNLQRTTVLSAALSASTRHIGLARSLLAHLSSAQAREFMIKGGLLPADVFRRGIQMPIGFLSL